MISTHTLNTQFPWFSPILDRLEQVIWGETAKVDETTPAFYVFKPYPSSLKPSQYRDWGQLQSKVLSPFEGGTQYVYLSHKGVCVWAVPNTLTGIPETAMQQSLPNGKHIVSGVSQIYQQDWQDGVMHSCFSLSPADNPSVDYLCNAKPIEITCSKEQKIGWAVNRNIDKWLVQPVTWLCVMSFVVVSILVWQFGAMGSYFIQQNSVSDATISLQEQVGDKLALQNQYQQQQNTMSLVINWQQQNGFLPQTLADVAEVVMQYDKWQADSIEWQGKRLVLLIQLEKADISTLVAELENTGKFSDVAIRPHSKANMWTLEVVQ